MCRRESAAEWLTTCADGCAGFDADPHVTTLAYRVVGERQCCFLGSSECCLLVSAATKCLEVMERDQHLGRIVALPTGSMLLISTCAAAAPHLASCCNMPLSTAERLIVLQMRLWCTKLASMNGLHQLVPQCHLCNSTFGVLAAATDIETFQAL